jgi:hypothetical protein
MRTLLLDTLLTVGIIIMPKEVYRVIGIMVLTLDGWMFTAALLHILIICLLNRHGTMNIGKSIIIMKLKDRLIYLDIGELPPRILFEPVWAAFVKHQ